MDNFDIRGLSLTMRLGDRIMIADRFMICLLEARLLRLKGRDGDEPMPVEYCKIMVWDTSLVTRSSLGSYSWTALREDQSDFIIEDPYVRIKLLPSGCTTGRTGRSQVNLKIGAHESVKISRELVDFRNETNFYDKLVDRLQQRLGIDHDTIQIQ